MADMDNGLKKGNQGQESQAYLILIGIGIFLIAVAILLYPQVRRIMEAENAFTGRLDTPTTEPNPPTATLSPEPLEETPTPALPTIIYSAYPNQFGTLILSLREGRDIHLFAYQPFLEEWAGTGFSGLPLTRLTYGPHQDITPDVSSDGKRVAFSSDRDGAWDIYILDLETGDVERFTDSTAYDGNPSWSPDGLWLAYETYQGGNLEIMIQDIGKTTGPIALSKNPAADYAPNWSPQGRWISFISDRSGREEVWYADLDSPQEDKAIQINNLPGSHVQHPSWSNDGRYLCWGLITSDGSHSLVRWDSQEPDQAPTYLGSGDWPLYGGDDEILYAVIEQPDQTYLTSYADLQDQPLVVLPAIQLPGDVAGISWVEGNNYRLFSDLAAGPDPTPLWEGHTSQNETKRLLEIEDLSAPAPVLIEDAISSFNALKAAVREEAGWDFLSTLTYAFTPLEEPHPPGVELEWLFTGRGIMINDLARLADWLVLAREDYGTKTYWRVYIKAYNQQGYQGRPLQKTIWDLDARYSGTNSSYENGGAYSDSIPKGYWVDFTALAAAYGWDRFPAQTVWQFSETASRYQYYAFTQDLDLEAALLEIYSPAEFQNRLPDLFP